MTNFTQNEQRMNESIDNFTQTEYLVTFLTFIYSFIATQFFNGWGKWIQNIDNDRPSLNHILFSILCFVLLIDFWWISFPRSAGMAASLPAFFASLFSPIIFSVLAFNIFPRGRTEDANLTAYFYRRGRFMFAILALDFLAIVVLDHILIGSAWWGAETVFRLAGVTFCLAGMLFPNRQVIRLLNLVGFFVLTLHIVLFGDPPVSVEGYGLTEHLTIFLTLVYGVIASRFISGWSHILQHIRTIQFSREHLAWSFFAFALLIDFWWGSWLRESYIRQHLGYFLLSLALPILFYAQVVVLFPFREYLDKIQLHDYFELHHRWIMALFGCILLVNAITANVMEDHWLSPENVYRLIGILLVIMVLSFRSTSLRRFSLVAASLLLIVHTILEV